MAEDIEVIEGEEYRGFIYSLSSFHFFSFFVDVDRGEGFFRLITFFLLVLMIRRIDFFSGIFKYFPSLTEGQRCRRIGEFVNRCICKLRLSKSNESSGSLIFLNRHVVYSMCRWIRRTVKRSQAPWKRKNCSTSAIDFLRVSMPGE